MNKYYSAEVPIRNGSLRNAFKEFFTTALLVCLIFTSNLGYSSSVEGQINNQSYTLKKSNVGLDEVLLEVQELTKKNVFFSEKDVAEYQKLNFDIKANSQESLMQQVLENTELDYSVQNQRILIFKDSETPKTEKISQTVTVTGVVVDVDGLTMPGVNVIEVGSSNGVTTDFDGIYSIDVNDANSQLEFSFMGYAPQTVIVGINSTLNITLQEDHELLDEIVVVAYGVQKKSDLTGAVSSVKSEVMEKVAVSTPAESLQGRIAGVSVSSTSGAPGAGMDVRIRGVASFGGNTPLYIIDGVEGNIDYVNPDDIASIEVLKDASSAAIYGSRAANGVVLVTTKTGEAGSIKVNFNAFAGPQVISKTLPLMTNSSDWLNVNKAAYINAGYAEADLPAWHNDETLPSTDWQDEMYQRGSMQNYNLSFNGGTEDLKFLFSTSYFDQKGTVIGTDFNKYNVRLKLDYKVGRLTVTPNFSVTGTAGNDFTSSFYAMRKITPLVPVYDENRESGYGYSDYNGLSEDNPVGKQNLVDNQSYKTDINTNVLLNFDITDNLKIKLNTGLRNFFYHTMNHHPSYQINPRDVVQFPKNSEYRSQFTQSVIEPMITYHLDLEKHGFDVLAGYTAQSKYERYNSTTVEGKDSKGNPAGFPDENFNTIDSGIGGVFSGNGTEYTYNRTSIFGRFNYSYDSKYLFQATLRQDGSSKFSTEYRYGVFPSVSAGWNIHKEEFWGDLGETLNRLKVRGSWGKLGSDVNLDNYFYQGLMQAGYSYPFGGSLTGGMYPQGMYVNNYRWEESTDLNIGLDFGLFRDKLTGSFNYYSRDRKDILVEQPLPYSTGMSSQMMNVAQMKNYGLELELMYREKEGEFTWGVTGTFSTVNNEVIALGEGVDTQEGSLVDWKMAPVHTVVGKSVGAFYLYKTDGLFQNQTEIGESSQPDAKPGDVRYVDVNNDGKIDFNDVDYSGSALPDVEFGLSADMAYKNFDLSVFFNGVYGNEIFNSQKYYGENMVSNTNYWTTTLDYWTPENTNTDMPRPVFGDTQNSRISDRFLEDGSFLRLKSAQIGYTLPKTLLDKANIDRLRFYVSGQNLFTLTSYSGNDPEIGGNSIWDMGIDWGSYPLPRTILFGVQLGL